MSICIRANVADTTDYAAIRADGYEAVITALECQSIAETIDEVEGFTAYPAKDEEDEAFYGHYVPSFGFVCLPAEAQAEILRHLDENVEAARIVRKAIEHRIQITFTRDLGDNQYRVRLVSELADAVEMNMSSGNWAEVRDALGLGGADRDADIDAGELTVAEVEAALDRSTSALIFSGEWLRGVASALRDVVNHAKAKGATSLVWA